MADPKFDGPKLARHMGIFALVVYGVGDMIGAGIYGTVGVAAGAMGNAVWLAFVTSMIAALLTGLSYASIASRYPRAAGAAYVTQRAYRLPFLSYVVGLSVAASGLTSMAAGANVFANNLLNFAGRFLPAWSPAVQVSFVVLVFLVVLCVINYWGIRESLWVNLGCTLVEVGGLVFVIIVGARFWGSVDYLQTPTGRLPDAGWAGASLILSGAVLTFFAFIGFEDMLNVTEECKDPERTVPWAMVIALLIVTVLYISVSVTAVSVVDFRRLADERAYGAPLRQLTDRAAPWLKPWVFTSITLFAVFNTALINYIMGSRLLYGMARQGLLPSALGRVHPRRRTPHVAILTLLAVVTVLALSGTVKQLASATSLLLLGCFCIVNVALIVLKRRPGEPPGRFEVPSVIPALGALVCGVLIVVRVVTARGDDRRAPLIAAGIGVGIALLYLLIRPKDISEERLAAAEHEADA